MKDDPLPPADHISRYCGGGSLANGEVTGASFKLRDGDEYLSVNWLEFLSLPTRGDEIAAVREVLSKKLTLGKTALFAVLNVEQLQAYVRNESSDQRLLRILHRPDEPAGMPDPSHSGIFDTAVEEDLIVELIAEMVIKTFPAKD